MIVWILSSWNGKIWEAMLILIWGAYFLTFNKKKQRIIYCKSWKN